jgi:chromosome segregation ATPase
MRNRAILEIDAASRQAAKTHDTAREQIESLAAGTASAVAALTERVVQDIARMAQESATEVADFLRHTNRDVSTTLQQFETRLGALRLPPEDIGEKLTVVLIDLAARAEQLQRATASAGAAYGELAETLAGAVNSARDGGRAFSALTLSADAATSAMTSAKTNVEQFTAHLAELGAGAAALERLPHEGASIIATLGDLRTHLGEANRAWAAVAGVTDDASQSMARAGAALSSLEHGTRAAEQSVLNWSGGLTKAGAGLRAVTEMTERAVQLGKDAVTTQALLSAQISGPLADQLRRHSDAAGALASRLQEDLRASEDAVRRVHHHLIDASRFILSKVE